MMLQDAPLDAFNTLRLACTAQYFSQPRSIAAAREAIETALQRELAITVLGGGSNVVLRSRLPGCVIAPQLLGIEVAWQGRRARVTAGAGVVWHDLVRFCLGQGFPGLANLALIPGHVGGAPVQNIGAYGVELGRYFTSLTALSCRDGRTVTFDATQCAFGYRNSVFRSSEQGNYLITSVTLTLDLDAAADVSYPDVRGELKLMGGSASAAAVAEAVIRVRRRKLPDVRRTPNAGSFFKNPILSPQAADRLRGQLDTLPTYSDSHGVKVSAAYLIDAAGWKGRALGRAAVWHRQPLVLINTGGASSADMLGLAERIRADISARYDVELELEPLVLGTDA
jgi:UDP-N-acetylmuramate dehydrogenase